MKPPSHKRTEFRGRRFTPSTPSTERPRGALMLLLCASPKLFPPPGWGQGLRPCTRFFLAAARGMEAGGGLHRLALAIDLGGTARPLASLAKYRTPASLMRSSLPRFHSTSRLSFARCAGWRSPPRPSRGARIPRQSACFGKKKRPTS